jgi:hypothetical protein
MLDLTRLAQAMQGISQHLTTEVTASKQKLDRAQQMLTIAQTQQAELVQKQQDWRDRLLFTAAVPVEPLNTRVVLDVAPKNHTVIATDGSQISPSHHEIAYCYLINIGRVMLHYGQNLHPLLDSLPEVFYQPEDLYVSRQWGIRTEEWMGYRRTASEAVALTELACEWQGEGERGSEGVRERDDAGTRGRGDAEKIPNSTLNTQHSTLPQLRTQDPCLAMVDGSLIYWFLEPLPAEARDRILVPILEAWEKLRLAQIPLMGYLSSARSIEALNFLRLPACSHPKPDCLSYCAQLERAPCQFFEPLRDTMLWASQLQPGERGPLWRSSAQILDLYGAHRVYFCYVHVGTEIARIEVPAWVAENSTLFNQALSLMLAQVQKGYGYPVALAEAHNQAVVRGSDRARFFAFLEQYMIRSGLRNVGISSKEARKRGSIA